MSNLIEIMVDWKTNLLLEAPSLTYWITGGFIKKTA